jgi:hypothetical protein
VRREPPEAEQRAVEAVRPHEKLLALPTPQTAVGTPVVLLGQAVLCVRDERGALLLDVSLKLAVRDQVCERNGRVALGVDGLKNILLDLVELRGSLGIATAAVAVREHAVVQSIRRGDAGALDDGC